MTDKQLAKKILKVRHFSTYRELSRKIKLHRTRQGIMMILKRLQEKNLLKVVRHTPFEVVPNDTLDTVK